MESSRLVRAVFALLVIGTVAAFVLTQSLKQEVPVVLRFATSPQDISPNGDGVRDSAKVGFDLSEPAEASFSIVDSEGNERRRLFDDRQLAGDTKHRLTWDGRDDDGNRVPDGSYRMRVARRKEGRVLDSIKRIRVDTVKPRVRLTSSRPGVIDPGSPRPVRVRVGYSGPRNLHPEFRVFRTDDGPPRIVRRFRGDRSRSGVWDGTVISGADAVDGDYAFQVRVRDLAGNQTIEPGPVPTARTARRGTGLAVRRLTLRGSLEVVPAGSLARLEVGPGSRRFQFALSRLGSRRTVRRDRRRGGVLRVRIPRRAHTGVYLVRVRSRGRRAVWPLAVAGLPSSRRALRRPRPLVVLPAVTWQGLNPLDSDLDGFADTLQTESSVPASRPFARGRLPARFRSEVSPLLQFLDRERLAYDLTTDLSLARRQGPALGNAPAVVFPGTVVWLPRRVRDRVRGEVERGVRVASFGSDSLKRTVALVDDRLRDPSPRRPDDLFGERTRRFRTVPAAPMRAERDRLGLFRGVDQLFGEFSAFERSERLPDGARPLSSAGREQGQAAFVAYRLGKGTVIRMGTGQWARELEERRLSREVPQITKRIWAHLTRR
ncbi:MAG: hypothetical protein M3131_05800 [Actinomycetota bacterium]|nr:hypothetical protein [Actinomycetota bacterium]